MFPMKNRLLNLVCKYLVSMATLIPRIRKHGLWKPALTTVESTTVIAF